MTNRSLTSERRSGPDERFLAHPLRGAVSTPPGRGRFLDRTGLRNVAQPASAVGGFFESIHSSASSQPCGLPAATHGTVELAKRAVGRDSAIQALQIFFVIPGIVGDQPNQLHRVVVTGIVKIERQLVIFLDALLDLFAGQDLGTKERGSLHAVVGHDLL